MCARVVQVRKYKGMMLEDLENALAEHAPAGGELASELPPLTIDGIPVSVDKMTQVSLPPHPPTPIHTHPRFCTDHQCPAEGASGPSRWGQRSVSQCQGHTHCQQCNLHGRDLKV